MFLEDNSRRADAVATHCLYKAEKQKSHGVQEQTPFWDQETGPTFVAGMFALLVVAMDDL